MIISSTKAISIAQGFVSNLSDKNNDRFAIMHEMTIETENGWLFFYNTQDFINTGDPFYALAGNGPIMIKKSGDIIELPSVGSCEESMKSISQP